MLCVIAWLVMTLDVAGALGLALAFGLMGLVMRGSITSSDRHLGLLSWAIGLACLAHPALGLWWCLSGAWWWAIGAGVSGTAVAVFGVWFLSHCIEAAARP